MKVGSGDVLIAIDLQIDFCPGGRLAVGGGDEIIPVINRVAERFEHVVLTQDWHTPDHASFASRHPGKKPYEQVEMSYGSQTLWPDHCVQGTSGAELHPELKLTRAELIVRKGFHRAIDSYSAFFENDRTTATGLGGYLMERRFSRVFLAGLAYDFCVGYSALDARRLGFKAVVLKDACRAIDLDGSVAAMENEFARAGVQLMNTGNLGERDED